MCSLYQHNIDYPSKQYIIRINYTMVHTCAMVITISNNILSSIPTWYWRNAVWGLDSLTHLLYKVLSSSLIVLFLTSNALSLLLPSVSVSSPNNEAIEKSVT